MSGTELSRLLAEVTAHPPVDVDFAAVQAEVSRRHRRRGTIGVVGVTLAVLLIAVPTSLSLGSSSPDKTTAVPRPTGTPTSALVIDPSWQHASWNDISWRMPAGWLSTDALAKLNLQRGPLGGPAYGPVISTVKVRTACSTLNCNGIADVIDRLPADGIVGELVVSGGFGGASLPVEDAGTVGTPDDICKRWGGVATFTSVRLFGTAPYTQAVSFSACLGSAQVSTAPAKLSALVASEVDAGAVTVDASWRQVRTGRLTMSIPPDWSFDGQRDRSTPDLVQLDGLCDPGAGLGTSVGCGIASNLHVGSKGMYAWISELAPPSDPASRAPYGGSKAAYADCTSAGGSYPQNIQRHLGPQDGGELLTLNSCYGKDSPGTTGIELSLVLNSIVDTGYPDPARLCQSVPLTVESSALETVGDIRVLKFGTARPATDVFPKAPASDFAAWCWVRDDAHQRFEVYAAHAGDAAVQVVNVGAPTYWGTRPPPSVAPQSLIDSAIYHQTTTPPPLGNKTTTPTASGVARGAGASALCQSALGDYVSAELTTVAQIRIATWGPQLANHKGNLWDAFPGASASDEAAWCWRGQNHSFSAFAVHSGDKAREAGRLVGWSADAPPSGQPTFP